MNAATTNGVGAEIDPALRQHIQLHSRDVTPQEYPPSDPSETVEMMHRRESEQAFHKALRRRTWWRLTAKEREALRAAVLAKASWATTYKDASLADMLCLEEIGCIITDAEHQQDLSINQ